MSAVVMMVMAFEGSWWEPPRESSSRLSCIQRRSAAIKKTPLLVQPGRGDGESYFGITNKARQHHMWRIASESDDEVFLNTYFGWLIPTLALSGSGDGDDPIQDL